jgi:hypothetical protein
MVDPTLQAAFGWVLSGFKEYGDGFVARGEGFIADAGEMDLVLVPVDPVAGSGRWQGGVTSANAEACGEQQ